MERKVSAPEARPEWSSLVYLLSVVLLLTSMVDLFVNRLLFRAGPEVLSHINFDATDLAVVGAISLNIEQLALFIVVGFLAVGLIRQGRSLDRLAGLVLIPLLVCSALLYLPLSDSMAWAVSVLVIGASAIAISGLAASRAASARASGGGQRIATLGFMLMITLGFLLPFYYRLSLLTGAAGLGSLPFSIVSYEGGIVAVWVASITALVYAIAVPSGKYRTTARTLIKAAVLPTLIVGPILYGLLNSFFMTQIFSLVVAMSTDFALSLNFVQVLALMWWFLLTAAVLLFLKGRGSANRQLVEEGIGLLLLMSTTFMFNYPYYLMLGVVGVLLITHPIPRNADQ